MEVYDALVEECGSIFHTRRWVGALGESARLLGLYEDDDTLVGGVVLGEFRIAGMRVLRPLPFTPIAGPFLKPRATSVVARADEVRRAAEAVHAWIVSRRPWLTMVTLAPGYVDTLPFTLRGYKVVPRYTYRLDLSCPEETIAGNRSRKLRNHIKAADRDGLVVKAGVDPRVIIQLQQRSLQRQRASADSTTMMAVMTRAVTPQTSYSFTTFQGDVPIATAFVVHDSRTAYYLLGGYDPAHRHAGAGPAALWTAILHAKRLGVSVFDFEGSSIPSVERYVREFGGTLTAVPSINKAWLPIEMGLKLWKRSMF